jgi:DNA repair protein RecO (recombination protein O)
MAIKTTEAVLLRKRDFRETSFILTFFTRDSGKIAGILKGARGIRPVSDITPLFFSIEHVVFYEKKKSDLFIISQCDVHEIFMNILKEWDSALAAYYILDLVDSFTELHFKAEDIFENLVNSLRSLDSSKESFSILRLFEIKLLMILGLWPGSGYFQGTKGALATLNSFEALPWQNASNIKLTREVGQEIKGITEKIITENLDKPLKTARFFR